jgi:E3 ubiquitin-protein ligase MARCH6
MVYGALVIVCLGGVVWSLALVFRDVLPIHWSTNEPVLEFPIDLLFYNFLMPLAVKFFKPSDTLHAMYSWWFRKCARILRLSWFLFGKRKQDEEGHFIRNGMLGLLVAVPGLLKKELNDKTDTTANFVQDGRYVRAPASDQVRIPKGSVVFLEVTEYDNRIDGLPDPVDDLYGRNSQLFKMVYLPPNFKLRIFLFILFIWIFAAVTGVAITIVPLVFGRLIFSKIIPAHVRKNDIYAFSIGIYILGSALYCVLHLQQGFEYLRESLDVDASTPVKVMRKVGSVGLRVLRILYVYAAFAIVLPTLFALAVEFYFIVPLHTYFAVDEPHIIHFVQSWTVGLLYVKLTARFILWHSGSRPAEALHAVTRSGYLDPDIRIATRAFIFPATTALLAALLLPFALASVANRYFIFGADPVRQITVYRYVYPLCLSFALNVAAFWFLLDVMKGWRMRIRDEVYLIGERLHNFGDRGKNNRTPLIPRLET